jgi:signal transduction histidine kinase
MTTQGPAADRAGSAGHGGPEEPLAPSEAERARETLQVAILAFRWVALGWMTVAALTSGSVRRPLLAWVAIALTAAWTAWLTAARPSRPAVERRAWVLAADLGLAVALTLASGLVVQSGTVAGNQPFFAGAYPVAAPASWGASRGLRAGLAAGFVLGCALIGAHLLNGVDLAGGPAPERLHLLGGALNYVIAGGAVGLVAGLLERSATQLRLAVAELVRARERAARLAERESLARQIHDSVLQALAMVHKRGRELADQGPVPAEEVRRLAEVAGVQQEALRALVLRAPEAVPTGTASLREELETVARQRRPLDVTVGATGPIALPGGHVAELAAAVRQALDNVVQHAAASRASVFADCDQGEVLVTVRDDGRGFDYDEDALAAQGKIGLLKSIKGRVEQLGGTVRVDTRPGAGTEIELRVPVPPGQPGGVADLTHGGGR